MRLTGTSSLVRLILAGILLAASVQTGGAAAPAPDAVSGVEPIGSDVFTTPRETLLREKPTSSSRALSHLPQGTRLTLVEARGDFLKVETASQPAGWISRATAVVFTPDASGMSDLATVGRILARNEGNRKLAAAVLERAAARLRESKTPSAEIEVLAGETAEAAATTGGPFPAGISIIEKSDSAGKRSLYNGAAFDRALELLAADPARNKPGLVERAVAGKLRARFPTISATLPALVEETSAWLKLAETAESPAVLRQAGERSGAASLALARNLLALGKTQDLATLAERLRLAGARLLALLQDTPDGRRLSARAAVVGAMRGNGSPAFPQEARVVLGPKERTVRIAGKLGALQLTVETVVGSTRDQQTRRTVIPLLPVPGSLRVSPDGRSVAWVEVIGPAALVPVVASLEKDEPAREIAFLSGGRPLRDQALAHVVSSLSGFSRDGQRLGFAIDAWNDTPGPAPRSCIVSVATGELLFETSRDMKSFQRLLQ